MRLLTAIAVSLVFVTGCGGTPNAFYRVWEPGTLPNVQFVPGDGKIDVMMGENHFTSYRYGDQLTKPILFPLRSPSGILVNRSYPLMEVKGESKDHPHHTGLFFTYGDVNGQDFWGNTTSPPQIKHIKTTEMTGGSGRGKLSTVMHWIDRNGQTLLEEKREMIFQAGKDEYIIDFDIELTAKDTKVVFGDTKEGMFAIRVAHWLKEDGGSGRYLSSEGQESEKNIWGRRAEWVRLQGRKDGRTIGIAIVNCSESVNYPTYWHARGYGLFAANPLGQYVFEKTRGKENPQRFQFTLEAGQTAHFGFRVIIYEGSRTIDQIEQQTKIGN